MKQKSFAKVNIFLKITGLEEFDGKILHTLNSRFMLVKSLFDEIEFVPCKCDTFTIEGMNIPKEQNIIYKAYKELNIATGDLDIIEFFYNHKVVVKKNIPLGAGLGGGSSNAATFINMVNEACNLKRNKDELAKIGAKVGADVPFFIYGYESANVSGFGDTIEAFDEEPLELEIITPNIHCNTAKVYQAFDECCLKEVSKNAGASLMLNSSKDILNSIKDPSKLNDLYIPALNLCPTLKEYAKEGNYLSGSGSSFFRVKG